MKYSTTLETRNTTSVEEAEYIENTLQSELLKNIGGLKQFYDGEPVVIRFKRWSKATEYGCLHLLSADVEIAVVKDYVATKHCKFDKICEGKAKKTRWELFKDFIRGEVNE